MTPCRENALLLNLTLLTELATSILQLYGTTIIPDSNQKCKSSISEGQSHLIFKDRQSSNRRFLLSCSPAARDFRRVRTARQPLKAPAGR